MSIDEPKYNIKIPLMEKFYSIQGEGFYQGAPAFFIRLAGCDINCTWCDVKESWNPEKHNLIDLKELENNISLCDSEIVIVTGGEPLMYNLDELTNFIHGLGKRAHLETAGAHDLTGNWDWICVSPKRFKKPKPDVLAKANELKVVISRENDFRFAEKQATYCNEACKLFIQPEWDVNEEILPSMINFVKNNFLWRITLQIHKYLDVR